MSKAIDRDEARVIKKYPNRRLYDTSTSSYIALSDIKALVMAQQVFVVLDAKTGQDLTRSILLQIILEEESNGTPLFNERMLANMIRFYGHAMQGMMGLYLENQLQSIADMQEQMQQQLQTNTHHMMNLMGLTTR